MAATVEVRLSLGANAPELDRVLEALAEAGADDLQLFEDDAPPRAALLFSGGTLDEARHRTAVALAGLDVASIEAREATSLDHGSTWLERLRPLVVGPLQIIPVGAARPSGDYVLELDSTGAFGSGLHVTTAMCLERVVELSPIEALLDVGTGTGILALAALRLGGERAVGTDTDEAALQLARANAARNGLDDRLVLSTAESAELGQQFNVTVANIATAALVQMSRDLVRTVGHRGILLLSGIRDHEAKEVGPMFRDLGLRWLGETKRDGWAMLELEASW